MKIIIVVLLCVFVVGGICFLLNMSYSNREIGLRNQIRAQQEANQAVFDQTWKIIQQEAQVATEYKSAFAKIYPALMEGRYGNERGGALMSFIQESNPNFDTTLYENLQRAIEAQRVNFTREQTKLLDLKREHDNVRTQMPSSWFVGGRPEIVVTVVTSEKTRQTFTTGKEDSVTLFK